MHSYDFDYRDRGNGGEEFEFLGRMHRLAKLIPGRCVVCKTRIETKVPRDVPSGSRVIPM